MSKAKTKTTMLVLDRHATLPKIDTIEELIAEGVAIGKSTHYGVLSGDKQRASFDLRDRYHIWKGEAVDFLRKKRLTNETAEFDDADDVPPLTRLVVTGWEDPVTVRDALLVRREVRKKMPILRTVAVKLGVRKAAYPTERVSATDLTLLARGLHWQDKVMPLLGGQRIFFKYLFDHARVLRNGKVKKKGESIHRKVLQVKGEYDTDARFRSALATLRRKLSLSGIPAEIRNDAPDHYILEIRY